MKNTNTSNLTLIDIFSKAISDWVVLIISTLLFGVGFYFYYTNSKPLNKAITTVFLDFNNPITTKFGEYSPLNNNSSDYLKLMTQSEMLNQTIRQFSLNITEEQFTNRIVLDQLNPIDNRSVEISLELSNENVDEILAFHVDLFRSHLLQFHQINAINFFKTALAREFNSLKLEKEYNLKMTPSLDSVVKSMNITDMSYAQVAKLNQQGFQISNNEFFNPAYHSISIELAELKARLWEIEKNLMTNMHLQSELKNIEDDLLSGETMFKTDLFSSASFMSVYIQPNKISHSSSNVIKNTILGSIIGFILALLVVMIKVVIKNKDDLQIT